MNPSTSVPAQARELLRRFEDGGEKPRCTDDLLLFLYRLHDRGTILESRSTIFRGKSFHPLHPLIYDLESRPDMTMADEHQCEVILTLLRDLASGMILVSVKE
ncbi:MAG TPA: hypothetical protein VJB38_07680 [Bacteroidota bacterium]|nr:hypothetical protein [Bacteroidota bacterium]